MAIIKSREALDITFHVSTPGVPVQIRYQAKVYDEITGETFSQSIDTDSQASMEDVRKYLGGALALGRDEERRAVDGERSALAQLNEAEGKNEILAKQNAAFKKALLDQEEKIAALLLKLAHYKNAADQAKDEDEDRA